jgi:3'(2'), 5'-bisphosphate nucleotidase
METIFTFAGKFSFFNIQKRVFEMMNEIVKEVVEIARQAGQVILDIYKKSEGVEIERKSDNSPLTIADKAANKVICDGLEKLDFQFPIISEENKEIPYSERKDYKYNWLVDPLDGTKEFIKRNGEFTVNIALIKSGQPVMGIVYAPVLDEMYWALKGEGAYLIKDGKETRISASEFNMTDEGLRVVCSRSHLNQGTQDFVDALNGPELVSKGSSLKFLILAKGEAELYPRIAPTMEWDTGAAQVVLEEAGGKVIDEETKQPLRYNKENLLNPFFIAYGKV